MFDNPNQKIIPVDIEKEMKGLCWGELYEKYHKKPYNPTEVSKLVQKLYDDTYINNRKGTVCNVSSQVLGLRARGKAPRHSSVPFIILYLF